MLKPKRALLLINPHSRQGKQQLTQAIAILESLGFDLVVNSFEHSLDFPQTIRKHQEQIDLVIVGGGDGTLNAAVEGILETNLPLGILPLGTANDLARTLGIPLELQAACQVIASGRIRKIDLGWVNDKHFFNVASVGLSVQITENLSKQAKRKWGVLAYLVTAVGVIWRSRPFSAEIRHQEQSIRVKTIQIAIGNGHYYGGGMSIAHDADIDDCKLDFYSLEVRHWWQIMAVLPFLWKGRHNRWLGVRQLEGQEIAIYTRKPHPINTDGEITAKTPAVFRVIPKAIKVIVPNI